MYFKKYDHLLDEGNGPLWLKKKEIADIVSSKIHDLDGVEKLLCYTIMPNHVHLLFQISESRAEARGTRDPAARYPVTHILKMIKGSTAKRANEVLGKTGSF